jgi:polyhydroxyalkanoate synthesis repressor PhaR
MNRSAAPRVIKKYSNRRLYDTAESRYITLDELAGCIRQGADVRVLDAQTGDEITQATLTQIILEGRGAAQFLSVPILTQLIRMNDDALADFFGRWISAALELYQQARQGAQAIAPYNPLAAVPFAATNVITRLLGSVPGPWLPNPAWSYSAPPAPPHAPPPDLGAPPDPVAPQQPPPVASDGAAVEALRRELDELKRSLQTPSARAAAKSSRRATPAARKPPKTSRG